jgi:hypothetical protein
MIMTKQKILQWVCGICLSILFVACDHSPLAPDLGSGDPILTGHLIEFNLGSGTTMDMDRIYRYTADWQIDSIIVISSCSIDSDGTFRLPMRRPPDVLVKPFNGLSVRFFISDSSAAFYPQTSFSVYRGNLRVGSAYCSEKSIDEDTYLGNYLVQFWYSTAKVYVSGQDTVWYTHGFGTTSYSLSFQPGWNQLIWQCSINTDTLKRYSVTVDSTFKGNWHFTKW